MNYLIYQEATEKLHFAYKGEKMEKNATITLFPEDIFPAIKGLLAQSASGLGRTSVHQLRTILDFYQSSDFENYEFR